MCSKVILTFFCLSAQMAFAICGTGQATTFQWPLDNWQTNCNKYWSTCFKSTPHLGADSMPSAAVIGTAVKAPCSGVVKLAKSKNGYGGTVILECWTGTECVTPIVGHMFASTLQVKVGQTIGKGMTIGYIADKSNNGGWAPHSHFGIHKGEYSKYGENFACDGGWYYGGYANTGCVYNDWYDPDVFMKTHIAYNFKPNGLTCKGPITGGANTNWIYTCNNPTTTFKEGDTVTSLIYLSDVKANHTYKVTAYRNDVYMWEWAGDKIYVDPVWGWNRSYFWPTLSSAQPGNWEFRFSVRADPEVDFAPLETVKFTVTGNSTGYTYSQKGQTCYGPVTGGASTNWLYTCTWPNTVFKTGDTVQALVRLVNVWNNHRFKAEWWRDGVYQWPEEWGWNDVGKWGWQYSHFWPTAAGVWTGNWEIRIYVDSGKGFMYLDTIPFTVM